VTTIEVDLFDSVAVRSAVAGHDVVVNLATHIPRSTLQILLPWAWRENDRLRRVGSATLVDAALAAGIARFVQESFGPSIPIAATGGATSGELIFERATNLCALRLGLDDPRRGTGSSAALGYQSWMMS
jgi:hypothetical protein